MPEAVALGGVIGYLPTTGLALESFAMFRPVAPFLRAVVLDAGRLTASFGGALATMREKNG